jgi:trimethylamine-N-oxide reductase cytochrome c-type subunit TorC
MRKIPLLISSLIILFSTSFLEASVMNKNTDVLVNGQKVGLLTVLTPVERVSKTEVKIKGFRLENYPQMIVRDMKRGELYVEFDEDKEKIAINAFKVIKSYEDEYGEIWQEVEGTLSIDTTAVSDDSKVLHKEAKSLYAQTCSMCHHLPEPHAYSVNQWPQQIESMMDQIPLDKPIKTLIVKYLQHNAADAK